MCWKIVKYVKVNCRWVVVLREYVKFYCICFQKIDFDVIKYFLVRNDSLGCKFVVVGGLGWVGLGNKVFFMFVVLLYFVFIQRVLFVFVLKFFFEIMCELFEGLLWGVDLKMWFMLSEEYEDVWRLFFEFEVMVDNNVV